MTPRESGMDFRTIIAMILMVLIYFYFFPPSSPKQSVATNAIETNIKTNDQVEPTKGSSAKSSEEMPQGVNDSRRLILENDQLQVSLDGLGGIRKVVFKNYKTGIESKDPVEIGFENKAFNMSVVSVENSPVKMELVSSSASRMEFKGSAGEVVLIRSLSLKDGSYELSVKDSIENRGQKTINAGLRFDLKHEIPKDHTAPGFFKRMFSPQVESFDSVYFFDGSVSRKNLTQVSDHDVGAGVLWSGFTHKYFFTGLVPQNISTKSFTLSHSDDFIKQSLKLTDREIEPKESSDYSYVYYLGPKRIQDLRSVSDELPKVIDYGDWIGPISRFLLSLLIFFHDIIPNYGLGILLLTILVKLALFPLVYKAGISMRKLQLVQPKMKEIKDRYKNDKVRLQAEMMTLYKTEKVNPVGGCFPILLQMPVFFALYRVFFQSIELRHQPFFGWIHDLSSYDPYFITPVLMTGLMYLQQQITPTPPSMEQNEMVEMQKKMMKWLPIIFGAFMLFLPAGLTLYFLANAGISILQQAWLNKHLNHKFPYPNQNLAIQPK